MADDTVDLSSIQSALDEQDGGWEAGATPLLDMSPEKRRLHLGAELPMGERSWAARERDAKSSLDYGDAAGAPQSVDLRKDGYITSVKDQGACGSCVAFGSVAAIEGTARVQAKQSSLAIDLSEAHLFYCHAAAQNRNCSTGWWVDPALDACRDLGVVPEAKFPYTAGNQKCAISGSQSAYRIVSYTKLKEAPKMKRWLADKGPLVACFMVYEDFYAYKSGVYRHVQGKAEGGHCVSIVGYDDTTKSWIAKNSWGQGWGTKGFFQIAYGEVGIDFEMWGVAVPAKQEEEEEEGTWLNARKITGLWADAESGGVSAFIADAGWKRVSDGPTQSAMVALLATARTSGALTDLRVSNDVIQEVYVL